MAIAFRASGAGVTDATAPFSQVVGFPAGLVAGDICILIGCTDVAAGGTMSISNNGSISSWNAISGTPVTVASGEKLYVWWGRYASGSTGPTVDSSADHIVAAIVAYSGCVPNGSPIDVVGTSSEATSDTSFSFATGLTTGENNTMCITICTSGFDSVTNQFASAFTNANLTSCTRRAVTNQNTSVGGGGGFGIADGILATAGAMGTFATTLLNATPKAYIAFSLRPEVPVNVSAGAGSLILDGFSSTVFASNNKNVAAGVGTLTLTGFKPVLDLATNPAPGQLAITGFAPITIATDNKNIFSGVGQLLVNGFAPTIQTPVNNNVGTGQLIAIGFSPTIETPINLNTNTGQITAAAFAPTVAVTNNINIAPEIGQFSIDGFSPVVELPVIVNTDTGQILVSGFEPVVFASDNKEILAGTGELTIDGLRPSTNNNIDVVTINGDLILIAFEPTLSIALNVLAGTGELVLTGFAPIINLKRQIIDFSSELEVEINVDQFEADFSVDSLIEHAITSDGSENNFVFDSTIQTSI